jgi:DNA-binding MurR/RpiR family transcriptional regulator
VEVAERIRVHSASLTAAERRVAEAILRAPQAVGFGTVADLADSAKVGAASVVRLASKLGFDGYSEMQASIQHDLMRQLRPAAERIDETVDAGPGTAHAAVELANVRSTLDAADPGAIDLVASRLADLTCPVAVLSGEASAGVAVQFVDQMQQLRDGVRLLHGSDVAVRRDVAVLPDTTTAIVIDLRRYERWVLEAHTSLVGLGIWSAALTDSLLSPLAARSDVMFVVAADSVGPFDSHVGTLALLNLIAAEAARSLRSSARDRLAAVEAAWSRHGSLTDTGQLGRSGVEPGATT